MRARDELYSHIRDADFCTSLCGGSNRLVFQPCHTCDVTELLVLRVLTLALISFRVDDKLKRRMEKLSHLNWSQVLRQYAARVVEQEEETRAYRKKDYAAIAEAMVMIDALRSKSRIEWNGAEEIKKWRRLRR